MTPTSRDDRSHFEYFELPGSIRLGITSTSKLKTVIVKVYVSADLDDFVTRRALVPMVLERGCRRYPDMQALNRCLEKLYGAGLYAGVAKIGEWHVLKFQLEVVNEAFLGGEDGLLREAIELLRDVIFDPHRVAGAFDPLYVDQEKANLKLAIESLVDDKASYAAFRCVEEMCHSEPYRFHDQGRVEDLRGIEPQGLYRDYVNWLDVCPMSIYFAGDVAVERARELIVSVFDRPRSGTFRLSPIPRPVEVEKTREVKEVMDVQQGKLVLGFRHGVTFCDVDYEALIVMNGVLGQGGFSRSKLFQNVREKANLAYYAHSWLERTKGLLFIGSGIAVDRYREALVIILEQVEAMTKGDFSDEDVDATIRGIINQNLMLEDNLSAVAEVAFVWSLHGRPLDMVGFRERIEAVTRDDIVRVARRLRHDTTYLLHS